jgi:hypothetical protein
MQSMAWSFSSMALMTENLGSVRMRLTFSSSPLFTIFIHLTFPFCLEYSLNSLKDLTYITIYDLLLEIYGLILPSFPFSKEAQSILFRDIFETYLKQSFDLFSCSCHSYAELVICVLEEKNGKGGLWACFPVVSAGDVYVSVVYYAVFYYVAVGVPLWVAQGLAGHSGYSVDVTAVACHRVSNTVMATFG